MSDAKTDSKGTKYQEMFPYPDCDHPRLRFEPFQRESSYYSNTACHASQEVA